MSNPIIDIAEELAGEVLSAGKGDAAEQWLMARGIELDDIAEYANYQVQAVTLFLALGQSVHDALKASAAASLQVGLAARRYAKSPPNG